ncbi:peptidase C15, pyroglutamyl peptidase I-like protein [Daedalea quercina L-15889]|uniref:Peptidase C15, pyroglutamyl peptidase I-like protein n=1 Tax=Daedalea quercina L-15889 TaxID=1314783 RepID=A0A165SIG9_9APHY|nr:peptidase C15, pyroglutamyl peptidase I-like protein [Daedalea quercina L-15889]
MDDPVSMDLSDAPLDPRAIRVLITGFGPFRNFNENPSWLAIRPLHNTVLWTQPQPVMHDMEDEYAMVTDEKVYVEMTPQPIHITCVQIPMTYEGVLATVPGLHAHPPVLPPPPDPTMVVFPPPVKGYDFVLHVALAGRGPLRFERLAHKHGYAMKDTQRQHAPALPKEGPIATPEASEIERMEMHLQGIMSVPSVEGRHHEGPEIPPNRGFGKGYENFPEEIHTDIDVPKLVHYLKEIEVESVEPDPEDEPGPEDAIKRTYTSMDAGHYICDFAFYCSLAEAKRMSMKPEKSKVQEVILRGSPAKGTPVLAMHVPPINQPFATKHVTDAIRHAVVWVCSRMHR